MSSGNDIVIGSRVVAQNNKGIVKYVGNTAFAPGKWFGVELDDPVGKNSGSVNSKQYFICRPNHGVFVRGSQIKLLAEEAPPAPLPPTTPNQRQKTLARPTGIKPPTKIIPQRSSPGEKTPTATQAPPPPPISKNANSTDSKLVKQRRRISSISGTKALKLEEIIPEVPVEVPPPPEPEPVALPEEPILEDPLPPTPPPPPAPQAPVALNDPPAATGKPEQTVPLKMYEELRVKLKILEGKRQEEREKLKEAEKAKEEAENFLAIRTKLVNKLNELQNELRESKKVIKDITQEKEDYEQRYTDLMESLELTQLDKEMAEEKAENLQQEVSLLKEKLDEVKVDLDVFRHADQDGGDNPLQTLNMMQLERQNERLKEALVRLRDVSGEQETEYNKKIKMLEKEVFDLESSKMQNEKIREQLDSAYNQIEELKQRVDDAIAAEEIVEKLSSDNMDLKEKIEELQNAIIVLEEDKEVSEEIEESRAEAEKLLQEEIDFKDAIIREHLKRVEQCEEQIADYENTVNRFRELVNSLQADLEYLRRNKENATEDANTAQPMLDLNVQIGVGSLKAQSKAIDLELRKLELSQATEKLAMIQPFLHELYYQKENNAIKSFLLFKRLVFKSELIRKHSEQMSNLSEKLRPADINEDVLPVCETREKLVYFTDLAGRFVSFLSSCSSDSFSKLGVVYDDLCGLEKRVNVFLDLLKTENFKHIENLPELDRAIAHLEHLQGIHMDSVKNVAHLQALTNVRIMEFSFDRIIAFLLLIKQALSAKPESEDQDGVDESIITPLDDYIKSCNILKSIARKIARRLTEIGEQETWTALKSEFVKQISTLLTTNRKIVTFLAETLLKIKQYLVTDANSPGSVKTNQVQTIVFNATENFFKISEVCIWDGISKILSGFQTEINRIGECIDDENNFDKLDKVQQPWLTRGFNFKEQLVLTTEMERRINLLNDEMVGYMKEIKLKERSMQEAFCKVELLENRMENMKKQTEKMSLVEEELAKSKQQGKAYEEYLENLQTDIANLEKENDRLKKIAGKAEKQLADKKSAEEKLKEVSGGKEEEEEISGSNGHLLLQISSLRGAVRYLRAENSELKKVDNLDGTISPDSIMEKLDKNPVVKNKALKAIALETRVLIKDALALTVMPKLIELQAPTKKWTPTKYSPDYQLQQQKSLIKTLTRRGDDLKDKLSSLSRRLPAKLASLS